MKNKLITQRDLESISDKIVSERGYLLDNTEIFDGDEDDNKKGDKKSGSNTVFIPNYAI